MTASKMLGKNFAVLKIKDLIIFMSFRGPQALNDRVQRADGEGRCAFVALAGAPLEPYRSESINEPWGD